MTFVFITGPMKSGKSLELIARVAPFAFADKKILYVSPGRNVRESNVQSRLGINAEAMVASSLSEIPSTFDVVGVDEVHMFDETDAPIIEQWVKGGKDVFISGLDLDYRGGMIPIVQRIFEFRPDTVLMKYAVCEVCHVYDARFTQILKDGVAVRGGLPPVVPDDGSYQYETRCRACFMKSN